MKSSRHVRYYLKWPHPVRVKSTVVGRNYIQDSQHLCKGSEWNTKCLKCKQLCCFVVGLLQTNLSSLSRNNSTTEQQSYSGSEETFPVVYLQKGVSTNTSSRQHAAHDCKLILRQKAHMVIQILEAKWCSVIKISQLQTFPMGFCCCLLESCYAIQMPSD